VDIAGGSGAVSSFGATGSLAGTFSGAAACFCSGGFSAVFGWQAVQVTARLAAITTIHDRLTLNIPCFSFSIRPVDGNRRLDKPRLETAGACRRLRKKRRCFPTDFSFSIDERFVNGSA